VVLEKLNVPINGSAVFSMSLLNEMISIKDNWRKNIQMLFNILSVFLRLERLVLEIRVLIVPKVRGISHWTFIP